MARDFVRTSNFIGQRITATSAVVTNSPCTFACWAKTNNTTDSQCLLAVGNATGLNNGWMSLYALGATTGDPVGVYIYPSTDFSVTTTTGFSSNEWFHSAATFSGNTPMSLQVFINGGSKGTGSTNYTPSGLNRTGIGALVANNQAGNNHFNGQLAECGIWNVVLTDDEIASLADGMSCDKVRPQNLCFYAPLVRDIADYSRGLTLTNVNTTVAAHPRVYA